MRTCVLTCSVLAVALGASAAEPGSIAGSTPTSAVVEINGAKISLADIEQKHPAAFFQARSTFYDAQRKAIEPLIDEYLLEAEAKKQNITVAELYERNVNSKIAKDPSEEALHVYYEGIDTTEPYSAVRGRIVDGLRERRAAKLKVAYLQSLRSQAKIAFLLPPPRAAISVADTLVRGVPGAPVTLVEYADYECPYCQQVKPVLDKLEAEYKGRVAFAYKDFPLNIHANAQKAAEATRCAASQNKYWEFHEALYARKQLAVPALKDLARELKLDGTVFDKCLDSGEKAAGVKAHATEAQSLGAQGTPTFFVNGRVFSGTPTFEALRAVVDEELGISVANSRQTAQR